MRNIIFKRAFILFVSIIVLACMSGYLLHRYYNTQGMLIEGKRIEKYIFGLPEIKIGTEMKDIDLAEYGEIRKIADAAGVVRNALFNVKNIYQDVDWNTQGGIITYICGTILNPTKIKYKEIIEYYTKKYGEPFRCEDDYENESEWRDVDMILRVCENEEIGKANGNMNKKVGYQVYILMRNKDAYEKRREIVK